MDKPRFVHVTYISSTPEKVFSAITDPEMTKDYWALKKNTSSDWQPGSDWRHEDYETGDVHLIGKVLENDPPRKLVITWDSANPEKRDPEPSQVTFLVEPFMDAVRLTVIHENLEPGSDMLDGITRGWPAILSSLKTLLETGHAMPMTMKRWTGPPK